MESSANPGEKQRSSLYPTVETSNIEIPSSSSSSNATIRYPSLDMNDLVRNIVPEQSDDVSDSTSAPPAPVDELILRIPGAILHLIDQSYSVELACGDLEIVRIVQGEIVVAVFARVSDEIQWPLTKDQAAVKLDESHYFFSLRPVKESGSSDACSEEDVSKKSSNSKQDDNEMLNYGLTIASKGQKPLLEQLDRILTDYSGFTVQELSEQSKEKGDNNILDMTVAEETSPEELKGEKKAMMEKQCTAYWTTLAPNVEDYSGIAARLIASGSGQLIKGILWCGDVTIDRLIWGNEFMKRKLSKAEKERKVSPFIMRRLKSVKKMTKRSDKVMNGVLTGVIKVSGFFSSSLVNSKAGKKLFGLLPGEMVLATLDGFNKVCDAVEVAGRNVMKTSSTVTTDIVDHKYGAKTAEATNTGLNAAGHALGTAWTVFKIRKALNPKSSMKPSLPSKTSIKSATEEKKSKKKGCSTL